MISNIPLDKIISAGLSSGAELAEIFAEETSTTSISHENRRIERASHGTDAGFGIRVIKNGRTSYGFTNDPEKLLELARSVAGGSDTQPSSGLDLRCSASPKEHEGLVDPSRTDIKEKIDIVTRSSEAAWSAGGDEIKQVQTSWRDTLRKIWVVNSKGVFVQDKKIDTIMVVHVTAGKDGQIQTGYEPTGGFIGMEHFKTVTPESLAISAARRAIMMLSARHAPSGVMPVVISSSAGGTMIHEAVGHGMEADLACQNMSVYAGKMGTQVASKLVTVIDDATMPGHRGSFAYDDEGTPAQRTVLIENGTLKNYMHNLMSSEKAGVVSTGNGRRESYRNRPVVRMTNTFIASGKDDPEKIIASVDNGLLVKKMGGGQVNTINGDFVFEAQEAYLIRNGKISEPVRGATLIGNGPKILMDIDMVGSDIGYGIGTCGKEGQGVPVGHGMPTIRIPSITVGGQA